MREFSDLHSCATCTHSTALDLDGACAESGPGEGCLADLADFAGFAGAQAAHSRAPMGLNCQFQREALGEDCVAAVVVYYDSRCQSYACRRDLFIQLHGFAPEMEHEGGAGSFGLRPGADFPLSL